MAMGISLSDVVTVEANKEGKFLHIQLKRYVFKILVDDQDVLKNIVNELANLIEKEPIVKKKEVEEPSFYKDQIK